jgi:hypothetical protein
MESEKGIQPIEKFILETEPTWNKKHFADLKVSHSKIKVHNEIESKPKFIWKLLLQHRVVLGKIFMTVSIVDCFGRITLGQCLTLILTIHIIIGTSYNCKV